MQPDIKPTWFLKHSLILSSVLIIIFGFYFVAIGSEIEKLIGTCLAIPFTTLYHKIGKIKLLPSYWINDLHGSFWLILSGLIFHKGFIYWIIPVFMSCLFLWIVFNRKFNFIKKRDCIRCNQSY